jgi:DNA-binding transcriptional MerR regulator
MAQMPVATLRIWEQRYRAVQPATAPSGHRLYSPADVQRVLLLRQLTEQGHAIGSIASLDSAQLQQVALASRAVPPGAGAGPARTIASLRLVVVGPALALRLQRPAVARHLAQPARVVAVFESFAEAARAASGRRADLLLWHAPELQPGVPSELRAAQEMHRARKVAVVYRYAGSAATRALTDAGAVVIREPADDDALGAWLASMQADQLARPTERAPPVASNETHGQPAGEVAPRRFDDATLTSIAGLSSTLPCECPRHVAELLMQLSSFETYSAGCIDRSPADARLHAYLHQVAAASRALFEAALERVARHEGLTLP